VANHGKGIFRGSLKIDSTGAMFFSWIFKELALNMIKYARAGGKVSISMEGENPLRVKWTNQPVSVQENGIPGSDAGLKALTILVEKVKGKLTKNGNDHFYEVKFFIPFN
jgi:two-component sensor histidine kinase